MIRFTFNHIVLTAAILSPTAYTLPNAQATVTFDWATVGNAGNLADPINGLGRVINAYRISKHEVTNTQYVEFLNAVDPTGANTLSLYNSFMASNFGGIELQAGNANGDKFVVLSGRENNPVTYVSWFDSIRFTNWLHNSQGSGDTETGAYTLLGGTATPSNIFPITRNTGADYFLPNWDEWYKAAYHDASAGTAGDYFVYATGSDIEPISDQPGDNAAAVNYANNDGIANGFNDGFAVSGSTSLPSTINLLTDVGAYTDAVSPYGTFDQNGNVWEWNEALIGLSRGLRGGSWFNTENSLRSLSWMYESPTIENPHFGFRVASRAPVILTGDLDSDGFVGITDLNIVLGNWNQSVPPSDPLADPSGDGFVGIEDLNTVLGNWNAGTPPGEIAVIPEPRMVVMLGLGIPALLRRRKVFPA